MTLTSSSLTSPGGRERNEDAVSVFQQGESAFFVVADGLGGHGRGDAASALAVSVAGRLFQASPSDPELPPRCILAAHDELRRAQAAAGLRGAMMTTMTAALVCGGELRFAHAGDSRLYLLERGGVILRTADHSVPQMLAACGEIHESEIRGHPDRNRILTAVGMDCEELRPGVGGPVRLAPGMALLLCTDGLWEPVDEAETLSCLRRARDPDEWLRLMEAAVWKDGPAQVGDNYSAIGVWVQ